MRFNLGNRLLHARPYRILPWDAIQNLRSTPVLKKKGAYEAYRKIGERLVETCLNEDGIGIATPQVGMFKRAFLIREFDVSEKGETAVLPFFKLYLNPKWVSIPKDGKSTDDEFCLSVPSGSILISRFNTIEASWDEFTSEDNFITKKEIFKGRLSRIFAHEHDHLLGISIPQRYEMQNSTKKVVAKRRGKKKNRRKKRK